MNKQVSLSPGMLRTNLRGQIRQTQLPKWKALLPLFEAVMNSFQAIQESDAGRDHKITITIERRSDLFQNESPPIVAFTVADTGVGFTDDNFDSFNTAYSEHKYERGGKGLGRFMWLKAFDSVNIHSIFSAQDGHEPPSLWERDFRFGFDYDPDHAVARPIERGVAGTTVRLGDFRSPYAEQCPTNVEVLALRLAEHFILVLMQPSCPKIEIHDQGLRVSLNDVFRDHFSRDASSNTFQIGDRTFHVNGFRLTAPRALQQPAHLRRPIPGASPPKCWINTCPICRGD